VKSSFSPSWGITERRHQTTSHQESYTGIVPTIKF